MMTNPTITEQDLIARLEKATGPDRELDYDIQCLVKPNYHHLEYTASIDAALTLVPKTARWEIGQDDSDESHGGYASVVTPKIYEAVTPAIALCIAALRARATGTQP